MVPALTLTHMSGPNDGQVEKCIAQGSPPAVTFGRLATCTVSLPDDPDVSRLHARLYWLDGGWWLEDLGSTNGTFVGEFKQSQRISRAVRLSPGQILRVGCGRFRLEATDAQPTVNTERMEAFRE